MPERSGSTRAPDWSCRVRIHKSRCMGIILVQGHKCRIYGRRGGLGLVRGRAGRRISRICSMGSNCGVLFLRTSFGRRPCCGDLSVQCIEVTRVGRSKVAYELRKPKLQNMQRKEPRTHNQPRTPPSAGKSSGEGAGAVISSRGALSIV